MNWSQNLLVKLFFFTFFVMFFYWLWFIYATHKWQSRPIWQNRKRNEKKLYYGIYNPICRFFILKLIPRFCWFWLRSSDNCGDVILIQKSAESLSFITKNVWKKICRKWINRMPDDHSFRKRDKKILHKLLSNYSGRTKIMMMVMRQKIIND